MRIQLDPRTAGTTHLQVDTSQVILAPTKRNRITEKWDMTIVDWILAVGIETTILVKTIIIITILRSIGSGTWHHHTSLTGSAIALTGKTILPTTRNPSGSLSWMTNYGTVLKWTLARMVADIDHMKRLIGTVEEEPTTRKCPKIVKPS